jgi:hypothetical protein
MESRQVTELQGILQLLAHIVPYNAIIKKFILSLCSTLFIKPNLLLLFALLALPHL